MKTYTMLLVVLLLSGCAHVNKSDFDRGPSSEEQFDQNLAACEMEAKKYTAVAGSHSTWEFNGNYVSMMKTCMRSKGHKEK